MGYEGSSVCNFYMFNTSNPPLPRRMKTLPANPNPKTMSLEFNLQQQQSTIVLYSSQNGPLHAQSDNMCFIQANFQQQKPPTREPLKKNLAITPEIDHAGQD